MNSPQDSPAKTASGKDCKKCIKKGSVCSQHLRTTPVKNSPEKKEDDWNKSKFSREVTEKLKALSIQNNPKKPLRSPRKKEPTDEYEEDIIEFLREKEKDFAVPKGFPDQKYIKEKMREIVVSWLFEVKTQYNLSLESLHLAIYILDKYLSFKNDIRPKDLQLCGVTALLIATKYEERYPVHVRDLVYITDNTVTADQIREVEVSILQTLKYDITCPTCITFSSIYFDILNLTKNQKDVALYFMNSSALKVESRNYLPSLVAAGAIFYAIRAFPGSEKGAWSNKMINVTGYTEEEVREVAILASKVWLNNPNFLELETRKSRINIPMLSENVLKERISPVPSPKKSSPKKVVSPKKIVSPKKSSPKKTSPKKTSPKKVVSPKGNISVKSFVDPEHQSRIMYSDRYEADDGYEYRHVKLPPEISRLISKGRLLTEEEWRSIGVQQSRGWVHYALHRPEPHILLFRRKK